MGGDPKWEFGGSYRDAVAGAEWLTRDDWVGPQFRQLADSPEHRALRDQVADIRESLRVAHVATMTGEQAEALDAVADDLEGYTPQPHLPFDPLYISISNPDVPPGQAGIAGLLLAAQADTPIATVFVLLHLAHGRPPRTIPSTTPWCLFDLVTETGTTFTDLWMAGWIGTENIATPAAFHDHIAKRARAVWSFLESTNVEVAERTELTRQARRQAERTGARIASTVSVRLPKTRTDRAPNGAHREFSHRFEVRGHYKHYGPDTMLFKATARDRPQKICHHATRGPVVRVWTPDYVKGPADRPLVPKVRAYPTRDSAR